jgi:hypothetical protein
VEGHGDRQEEEKRRLGHQAAVMIGELVVKYRSAFTPDLPDNLDAGRRDEYPKNGEYVEIHVEISLGFQSEWPVSLPIGDSSR